jgi:serralysin
MATTPTALESFFLQLVNEARAKVGSKPLTFDGELLNASDSHSAWMDQTDTFSHTGINGSSPSQRMTAAGYGWTAAGENIAYVSGALNETTVQQLFNNLMNSSGHRTNIERALYEETGIGLHQGTLNGRTVTFVTQNFGTPNSTERAEANDVGTTPVVTPPPTTEPIPTSNVIKGTSYSETLTGTGGNDVFQFSSSQAAHDDRIAGFTSGDKIDVSLIDADVWVSGNQAFRLLDSKSFTTAGDEIVYVQDQANGVTRVYGNTDHDTSAEFRITVQGIHTFTAVDFIL